MLNSNVGEVSRKKSESIDRIRKISFQEFQQEEQLFGVYRVAEYKIIRGFTHSKDNTKLYYTKFEPNTKVGSVCIVHGYGENSEEYHQIADYLANYRFSVHIVDLRGYGYSGGSRVHQSLHEVYFDIQTLLKCSQPNLPKFILSHGLGATLVISLLIDNPGLSISGVIVLNPTFSFPKSEETFDEKILKKISGLFADELIINTRVNPTGLTKDNKMVKKIIQSGLNQQLVTLKMMKQIEATSQYILNKCEVFEYPIIVHLGQSNSFQSIKKVQQFYCKLGSQDKTLRRYEEGLHIMHMDCELPKIISDSLNWMTSRLGQSKGQCRLSNLKILSHSNTNFKRNILIVIGIAILLVMKIARIKK